MRIGHGYDAHKLVFDRKLILGGVEIFHKSGLLGHSDADVLTHAIMDSLLGAAGLGDIGKHFPETDQNFKGANSLNLLGEIVSIITEKSYKIVNIDSTLILQEPKISPYIPKMQNNIAATCKISQNCVSIKATTEEQMGFTGRLEGIAAHAVCLIE